MSSIKLTSGAVTVDLPESLQWTNEFSRTPVVQSSTYTTTGALILEQGVKQAGRPIELQAGEDFAWCTRALVKRLRQWTVVAGLQMALQLRGQTFQVVFDHGSGALDGVPILPYDDDVWLDQDFYYPTLRFLVVG